VIANEAERRKHLKYEVISSSHYFVPIAIETFSVLGEEAMLFLKELSDRITAVIKDSLSLTCLMQCVSITVQQGNAACIMETMLNSSNTESPLWPRLQAHFILVCTRQSLRRSFCCFCVL